MKKIFLLLIIALILLSGCAPTPEAIQKAIAQTQTAMPTPTRIPLSAIDISTLIFEDGDLPAGYTPAQIKSEVNNVWSGSPDYINWFGQTIANGNKIGGLSEILIYETEDEAMLGYKAVTTNMIQGDPSNPNIGDESLSTSQIMFVDGTVDVAFRRCNAVAHVQLMGTTFKDDAISYMFRVNKRLSDFVCQ